MPVTVQCPNPACGVNASIDASINGRNVRCKKCGQAFVARPTLDGQKIDTEITHPLSNSKLFPALPTDFGRYRVLKLLGQGGMGAVYLAEDSQLGRQVALKLPFFSEAESTHRIERFVREARSAASLHHSNICTVFDAGQIDGRPFLTMAYIPGKTLEDEIEANPRLSQTRAATIVRKIALALAHAHGKGTVHRDLKPANVMIGSDGEPVVMDFGLAKRVADEGPKQAKLTRVGGIVGTPGYMSPEQVRGEGEAIGPATDIYALGVILFELLTGKTPYNGSLGVVMGQILSAPVPPIREFRPDVNPQLDAICRKAMAKDPADRFATMEEFASKLGDYLSTSSSSPELAAIRTANAIWNAPSPKVSQSRSLDGKKSTAPSRLTKKSKQGKPGWRYAIALAAGILAVVAMVITTFVLRFETPNGTLVVEIKDPEVEARIKNGSLQIIGPDGKVRYTLTPSEREKKIDAGPYQIRVDGADGLRLDTNEFTMKKGDTVIVKVTMVPKIAPKEIADNVQPMPKPPEPKQEDLPPIETPTVPKTETPSPGPASSIPLTLTNGFVCLFNGKDLTGWSVDSGEDRWKIGNGQIMGVGLAGDRGWLVTQKEYENFILKLEFQLSDDSDGAVGIRIKPREKVNGALPTAAPHHLAIKLTSNTKPTSPHAGALYYWPNTWQQPAKKLADFPNLYWNKLMIQLQGDELRVAINEEQIQSVRLSEYAKKPKVYPAVSRPVGRIGLEQHHGEVRFRNIEIKELNPAIDTSPSLGRLAVVNKNGSWRREGDELVQTTNGKDARLWFGDPKWTDYDFKFEVKHPTEGVAIGTLVRCADIDHGILCVHEYIDDRQMSDLNLYLLKEKNDFGAWFDATRWKAKKQDWDEYIVQVRGQSMAYSHDKTKLMDRIVTQLPLEGATGFRTWGAPVRFRNIRVTSPDGKILWDGLPALSKEEAETIQGASAIAPKASIPDTTKVASKEYADLAKGDWLPVMPSEKEFKLLLSQKSYTGTTIPKYLDGAVICRDANLIFPSFKSKDAIIRARVKKVEGQNVSLILRHSPADCVIAYFNGANDFGIGRISKSTWNILTTARDAENHDDFFEFAFAAIGTKLTAYADGRRIMEVDYDPAAVIPQGIRVGNIGLGMFRDIEVQLLDKLPKK